jgi:hypothetical protein
MLRSRLIKGLLGGRSGKRGRRIEAIFAFSSACRTAIARVARRGGNVAFRATLVMLRRTSCGCGRMFTEEPRGFCASGLGPTLSA